MPYNYKGDLYKREVVKNCRIWVWMLKALMLLIKSWRRWDCSFITVMVGVQPMQAPSFQCGIRVY